MSAVGSAEDEALPLAPMSPPSLPPPISSVDNRRKKSQIAVIVLGAITLAAIGTVVAIGIAHVLMPTPSERLGRSHNEALDGPFRLHAKVVDGDTGSLAYVNLPQQHKQSPKEKQKEEQFTQRKNADTEWQPHPLDTRPLVFLLHGIKTDSCLYPPLIQKYWHDTRGLVFVCADLLGHGLSPWPNCALTAKRHVAALDALLQKCNPAGKRPVHIVGMSLGALLGLELTAHLVQCGRAPATVSLLATPYFESREKALSAARAHSGWFRHRKCSQFACRYLLCRQSWFWRHALKAYFRKQYPGAPYDVLNGALTHSASGIASCVDDVVLAHRPMAAASVVKRAKVPSLLIDGSDDRLCDEEVRAALRRDLPHAITLLLPPGAGHDFVISQPKDAWRAIENFVNIARLDYNDNHDYDDNQYE
jgi:pimeloyl-ACP methyl ester carboxylesterase